eukprot:gb/GECG01003892.1/.p1 GENE.gb/GECG01003892.1/~~gb/GECG01003892.1/.p1  ORF type:complete len:128 (+),score=16.67 gb/GECG01003892.1/:1-384(+)
MQERGHCRGRAGSSKYHWYQDCQKLLLDLLPICHMHVQDERSDGIMFSYILTHTNAVLRAITDASHFREIQRKLQSDYSEQKLKENVEAETNRRMRRENELANARNESQTLKKGTKIRNTLLCVNTS